MPFVPDVGHRSSKNNGIINGVYTAERQQSIISGWGYVSCRLAHFTCTINSCCLSIIPEGRDILIVGRIAKIGMLPAPCSLRSYTSDNRLLYSDGGPPPASPLASLFCTTVVPPTQGLVRKANSLLYARVRIR